MNAEAAGLVRQKAAQAAEVGKDALAKQVLKHLKLKTVVKVSDAADRNLFEASRQKYNVEGLGSFCISPAMTWHLPCRRAIVHRSQAWSSTGSIQIFKTSLQP